MITFRHFAWVVDDAKCIVVTRVCVSICLSAAARPHYCTDPDVTWGNGRGCSLVVHYLADLQSVHRLRCYVNITRTRNVSEYMLVLAECLVRFLCGRTITLSVCYWWCSPFKRDTSQLPVVCWVCKVKYREGGKFATFFWRPNITELWAFDSWLATPPQTIISENLQIIRPLVLST